MQIEISIFTWIQCCQIIRLKLIKISYLWIVHVSATYGVLDLVEPICGVLFMLECICLVSYCGECLLADGWACTLSTYIGGFKVEIL